MLICKQTNRTTYLLCIPMLSTCTLIYCASIHVLHVVETDSIEFSLFDCSLKLHFEMYTDMIHVHCTMYVEFCK